MNNTAVAYFHPLYWPCGCKCIPLKGLILTRAPGADVDRFRDRGYNGRGIRRGAAAGTRREKGRDCMRRSACLCLIGLMLLGLAPAGAGALSWQDVWALFDRKEKPVLSGDALRDDIRARAEVLRQLGIVGLDDQEAEQMAQAMEGIPEEYRDGIDLTREILIQIGIGKEDPHSGEWRPTSHRVYAFDTEVFDLEHMYTNFLKGVAAVNRGEFAITGVEEDTSKVDWQAGNGEQTIRFLYDGHPHSFTAEVIYDWMDLRVVDFMNEVFEKEGNPKRLYRCAGPGDQIIVLFYEAGEWADRFEALTGLELE